MSLTGVSIDVEKKQILFSQLKSVHRTFGNAFLIDFKFGFRRNGL